MPRSPKYLGRANEITLENYNIYLHDGIRPGGILVADPLSIVLKIINTVTTNLTALVNPRNFIKLTDQPIMLKPPINGATGFFTVLGVGKNVGTGIFIALQFTQGALYGLPNTYQIDLNRMTWLYSNPAALLPTPLPNPAPPIIVPTPPPITYPIPPPITYPIPTSSVIVVTAEPAMTDDTSKAYNVGSIWIDSSTQNAFICVSNVINAAVWKKIDNQTSHIYTPITNGQTIFTLPVTSIPPSIRMTINGVEYGLGPDFSIAGNMVTWNNEFSIVSTDELIFIYS